MNYSYEEVARYATQLLLTCGHEGFADIMQEQFPGLSNYMLRKALKDAKILVALQRELKREHS
jgi:hypothetical protein